MRECLHIKVKNYIKTQRINKIGGTELGHLANFHQFCIKCTNFN